MFKGKRLLSLLIAICVLVSAIVPVAMITADTPQKTMVKLELNADERMRLNNITIEKGVNYILSFDYNLSGLESGCEYKVYDFTTGNDFEPVYLENGVGHVEVTYAMNSTSNAKRTRIISQKTQLGIQVFAQFYLLTRKFYPRMMMTHHPFPTKL